MVFVGPAPLRILGAGPAGLAAAITLASAGRAVDVLERRRDCGARFGGDLQGLENWSSDEDATAELARCGLDADFYRAPVAEGFQTNGRRVDRLCFPRPAFYRVKRGRAPDTLDQGLKRRALDAGVRLHFGATRDPAEADVVATGPRGLRPFAVDRGVVFRTDAPDLTAILLDDRFATVHAAFAAAREVFPARWPLRMWDVRPVSGVGHFAGLPRWRQGRALLVGEAAGLQDFLWGFGIRSALRSGVLAARALLDGANPAERYARDAVARFVPLVRSGVVNRALWEVLRHGRYAPAMAALRWGGPYALMRAFHRFHPVQRALYPVARHYVRRAHPHVAV